MVNLLRAVFVAWCVVTYILAFVFSGRMNGTPTAAMLLSTGLIFYIFAALGLQLAHAKDKRPVSDLVLVAAYPVLLYFLLARGFDASRRFWIFVGYLQFILITGGFLLGIMLGPVIAWGRGMPAEQARGVVQFGLSYMRLFGRRVVFLILLFAGTLAGMVVFGIRLLHTLPEATPVRDTLFAVLSATGLVVVVAFTYRHTVFNLLQNPELRKAYTQGSAVS